ncbi:hypothetical protein ACJX0J_029425, partial [Zea mays]
FGFGYKTWQFHFNETDEILLGTLRVRIWLAPSGHENVIFWMLKLTWHNKHVLMLISFNRVFEYEEKHHMNQPKSLFIIAFLMFLSSGVSSSLYFHHQIGDYLIQAIMLKIERILKMGILIY